VIKSVTSKFITSAPSIKEAPPQSVAEVAFLGRSNVGKSSLLNALVDRKNLAKSSATPGKTKLINFFDVKYKIDDEIFPLRFVDLPGYGYAKASKSLKSEWQKNLTNFIAKRDAIKVFVHLIDSRHHNLAIDKDTREFLQKIKKGDQIVLEVFTKADKLKQKEIAEIKKKYPDALLISSVKKRGVEELKKRILEHIFGKNILSKTKTN
jgi:GTP-binding protein